MVARAAYDVSVSLYQTDEIELRQGSRVIRSSATNSPQHLTRRSCYVLIAAVTEWGELSFKVVRLEKAGQEVLARG
jgi:hypothetical protein